MGIFELEEKQILQEFHKIEYEQRIEILDQILYVQDLRFSNSSFNKLREHQVTILLLLLQNVSLINNAITLLKTGYLRASEIILRTVIESVILATYFTEFPEVEREYRSLSYREFFHKHKIEKMLKKVHDEGRRFVQNKTKEKKIDNLYKVFYKDSSTFLHNDVKILHAISVDRTKKTTDYIIGPQIYEESIILTELNKLVEISTISLLTLYIAMDVGSLDENEELILNKALDMASN